MVEFGLVSYPSCVDVIVILALCLASCVEVVVLERGVVYSLPCTCKFLSGGSLCGRSCVDIAEILLCEGGNVKQWLEPRNISCCLRLIHYI